MITGKGFKFTDIPGQVVSDPVITCESPMDLTFNTDVHGDTITTHFMGSGARALADILRNGDLITMNGIARDGVLVVGHITMDKSAAIGRNLNTYA